MASAFSDSRHKNASVLPSRGGAHEILMRICRLLPQPPLDMHSRALIIAHFLLYSYSVFDVMTRTLTLCDEHLAGTHTLEVFMHMASHPILAYFAAPKGAEKFSYGPMDAINRHNTL